ncbi:MAG: hypothetical protein CV045_02675 [Cyanobacteria bacterium M5B4]|nr:MAG: hypothetical protein CV045_02675 [Cyanobacteria bacterium M5B4]
MSISFEQAIEATASLLNRSDLSPQQLGEEIASLISTESGARGFFVTFLTGDWELADRPTPYILQALRDFPHPAAELLVKNLAMSTAMAITHRRNQQLDLAQSSDRVQQRSRLLIQQVGSPELQTIVADMSRGNYESFFDKWGYDSEQRQAIAQQLQACLEQPI